MADVEKIATEVLLIDSFSLIFNLPALKTRARTWRTLEAVIQQKYKTLSQIFPGWHISWVIHNCLANISKALTLCLL